MSNIIYMPGLVIGTLLSITGQVAAETALCDRKIEGVSVRMSADEARTAWLSRGFIETTVVNPREARGTTKRVEFADHIPKPNEGYRGDRVQLSFVDTGKEVSVTRLFHDKDGDEARARMAEFCPNGPQRGGSLSCVGGAGRSLNVNISVNPEPPETAGRCSYSFSSHGLVNETVRLSREPSPRASTLPSGRPAPKPGPRTQR